jgi:hypothetical protein
MHVDFVDLDREARVARLLRGGRCTGYTLRPFVEVLDRAQPWLSLGDRALTVCFEDLVGPNGGGKPERQALTLAKICDHLELTPPKDPTWVERIYGGSLTFNKGRIQHWQELESRDLRNEIDEQLTLKLRQWGYATDPTQADA